MSNTFGEPCVVMAMSSAKREVSSKLVNSFLEERRRAQNTSRFLVAFLFSTATWVVYSDDHV